MVTETMLKSAATEANVAKMAFLDRLDVKLHVFSEKFEKKIGKLVRRAKHPMLYKILRYGVVVLLVAAVLLALCGYFCNPEQTAPGEAQCLYDYYLPSEPQGYTLVRALDRVEGKTYLYRNETGRLCNFSYEYSPGMGELFDNMDAYEKEYVTVGDCEGELYITTDSAQSSILIWRDGQTGALLRLMGHFSREQLMNLAQSIRYREISTGNE